MQKETIAKSSPSEVMMYNQKEFTLEFIWAFWGFLELFKNPREAMILIVPSWGLCTVEEAGQQLISLKEALLKLEHVEYGGSDYAGDKTFKTEVDSLIEELRQAVCAVKKKELVQTFLNITEGQNIAG